MKNIKSFLLLVLSLLNFLQCSEPVVNNSSLEVKDNFQIPVWNYSENHYFIDTLYKNSFLAVMNDSTGVLPQFILDNKIRTDLLSFQVWVQCDNTVPDKRIATAWILLRKKPSYGYDSATYKRKEFIQDSCFFGFFRELNPSEYYINPLVGFIGLKINVPENYAVAVTYETYDGKKYGEGKYETNGNETMILKMIKCPNQSPDATPRAWELKMKNVYRLPINYINQFNFRLSVKYLYNEIHTDTIYQYYLDTIPTTSWPIKQMLSIDRYTGTARRWNPDGIFDFIEGRTIISETGDIIFPTLKPFSEGLSKAGLDSNYIFNELYERRKSDAQISHKANYYFLKGYSQGNKY